MFLNHKMELVSFASGGEGSTSSCIAYVAKDDMNRRICYVLQSLSGLESMIISTIGQAFDLKYSDSLNHDTNGQHEVNSDHIFQLDSTVNPNMQQTNRALIHHNDSIDQNVNNFKQENSNFVHQPIPIRPTNDGHLPMQGQVLNKKSAAAENLDSELWFHGNISRAKAEELLRKDGDFLVRECSQIPGQYVLSGRYACQPRHLLLVDPEGVVRTRGCRFDTFLKFCNVVIPISI
ncbi:hypothetical protein GJ496_011247 [Pomphorhynchus laevis]|nr:hypothetical protein GJ496_011247 [Pomphorhynchus laevis]